MTGNNVSFNSVASATLRADNHTDASRTVEISADVHFSGTDVTGFSNGIAYMPASPGSVCVFSENGGDNISTEFRSFATTDDQVSALREIKAFITAARTGGPSAFNLQRHEEG